MYFYDYFTMEIGRIGVYSRWSDFGLWPHDLDGVDVRTVVVVVHELLQQVWSAERIYSTNENSKQSWDEILTDATRWDEDNLPNSELVVVFVMTMSDIYIEHTEE